VAAPGDRTVTGINGKEPMMKIGGGLMLLIVVIILLVVVF